MILLQLIWFEHKCSVVRWCICLLTYMIISCSFSQDDFVRLDSCLNEMQIYRIYFDIVHSVYEQNTKRTNLSESCCKTKWNHIQTKPNKQRAFEILRIVDVIQSTVNGLFKAFISLILSFTMNSIEIRELHVYFRWWMHLCSWHAFLCWNSIFAQKKTIKIKWDWKSRHTTTKKRITIIRLMFRFLTTDSIRQMKSFTNKWFEIGFVFFSFQSIVVIDPQQRFRINVTSKLNWDINWTTCWKRFGWMFM